MLRTVGRPTHAGYRARSFLTTVVAELAELKRALGADERSSVHLTKSVYVRGAEALVRLNRLKLPESGKRLAIVCAVAMAGTWKCASTKSAPSIFDPK